MCGWCLACCIGVVLNTVRESAAPDCKEKKQADAGSRLFSKAFSVRRVVVQLFIDRQSVKVYLHMYNGNMQQNSFMRSILSLRILTLSPVLVYDFLLRRKFSTPTCIINKLYAQNPLCSKLFMMRA